MLVGHKEVEVNSTNEVKPGSEVKSAVIPVSSNQQRPVIGQNQHAVKPKKGIIVMIKCITWVRFVYLLAQEKKI